VARNERDIGNLGPVFAVTNWTNDVAMDCNTAADAELADVLGSVIRDLQEQGILKGTVST